MRNFFLVLLCFSLAGCTTVSKARNLEKQLADLQENLLKNNGKIRLIESQLKLKENQLSEKDAEIERLRKQLEGFGVFNN